MDSCHESELPGMRDVPRPAMLANGNGEFDQDADVPIRGKLRFRSRSEVRRLGQSGSVAARSSRILTSSP